MSYVDQELNYEEEQESGPRITKLAHGAAAFESNVRMKCVSKNVFVFFTSFYAFMPNQGLSPIIQSDAKILQSISI